MTLVQVQGKLPLDRETRLQETMDDLLYNVKFWAFYYNESLQACLIERTMH